MTTEQTTTEVTDANPATATDHEHTTAMTNKPARKKSAVDAPRGTIFHLDPDDLTIIGHDTAHKSKADHFLWDKRALREPTPEFVESLADGIDTTVLATKRDGKILIVAGRQRTKGARVRNKGKRGDDRLTVPTLLVTGTDLELMLMSSRENGSRTDLDMLERAADAKALIAAGATKEDVARTYMVSTKAVDNWLALDGASKPVRDAVLAGKIPATAATKIARLADPEAQAEALEETLARGKVTTATARAAVAKRKGGKGTDTTNNHIGLTSRKDQKRLLTWIGSGAQPEKSVYWDGVADALKVVLGEAPADARIKSAVKKALKAA